MMLFQQLELALKYILANGEASGPINELKNIAVKRASDIATRTMGHLVGQYVKTTDPEREKTSSEPEETEEGYFSFSFRIDSDSIDYETRKETLEKIVSERNELVHHLLPIFDINSAKSCEELEKKLDDQSERIRQEIKNMTTTANALDKGKRQIASFLGSEDFEKQFEISFLRQSRLVLMLRDIAGQIRRPDGWAVLEIARQRVIQDAPEELSLLKERYGYKSLESLILATERFDISEEATQKGGD